MALESISGKISLLCCGSICSVGDQHLANELALVNAMPSCVVMKISLVALSASATATATLSELTR